MTLWFSISFSSNLFLLFLLFYFFSSFKLSHMICAFISFLATLILIVLISFVSFFVSYRVLTSYCLFNFLVKHSELLLFLLCRKGATQIRIIIIFIPFIAPSHRHKTVLQKSTCVTDNKNSRGTSGRDF